MLYYLYGLFLVLMTPVLWTLWDNPLKWSPGVSLALAIVGCVVPAMGMGFMVGGERFYKAVQHILGRQADEA